MMREVHHIEASIETFNLDLSNRVVFTEAATGDFRWTALIALKAHAKKVYALAKDSPYGSKEQAASATLEAAASASGSNRLETVYDYHRIPEADIITNLGFVRPINLDIVRRLKPTAVIPLMWETWEYRQPELDLKACFSHNIMVLGTNEDHPDLKFMSYIGLIALKLLFEANIEILRSRILVVGGAKFGSSVCAALSRNGGRVRVVCRESHLTDELAPLWAGDSLTDEPAGDFIKDADAIVLADHLSEDMIIGQNGQVTVDRLLALNKDLRIVHISGLIDSTELKASGYQVYPSRIAARPRTMSVTAGYIGPRPIIELHTAGLKLGQEMAAARMSLPDFREAKKAALKNKLCMDFSTDQLIKAGIV